MKFNPDAQLNIHELAVEGPEKQSEAFFDPKIDLPKEKIEAIKESLKEMLKNSFRFAHDCTSYAACLKLLGEDFVIPEDKWQIIVDACTSDPGKKGVSSRDFCIPNLLISGQNIKADYAYRFEADLERVKCSKDDWSSFRQVILQASLAILGHRQRLEEEFQKRMMVLLHIYKMNNYMKFEFSEVAASLKIMGIDPKLSSQDKKWLKKDLHKWPEKDFKSLNFFANLSVLSADEVRIPEGGGLELIRHKKSDLQTETPQMPEQKQF